MQKQIFSNVLLLCFGDNFKDIINVQKLGGS